MNSKKIRPRTEEVLTYVEKKQNRIKLHLHFSIKKTACYIWIFQRLRLTENQCNHRSYLLARQKYWLPMKICRISPTIALDKVHKFLLKLFL